MKSSCLKQGTQTEFSDIGASVSSIFRVCNPWKIHDQIFPGKLCVLYSKEEVFSQTLDGWYWAMKDVTCSLYLNMLPTTLDPLWVYKFSYVLWLPQTIGLFTCQLQRSHPVFTSLMSHYWYFEYHFVVTWETADQLIFSIIHRAKFWNKYKLKQ